MISDQEILHFDLHEAQEKITGHWLPSRRPLRVLMTSGASCPDAIVEAVVHKLCMLVPETRPAAELIQQFT